jgi:putative selenate reductase molybdopterin-binding subunit
MKLELEQVDEYSYVGKGLARVDAVPKVTGEAKYYDDISLPGLLIGKILRSPFPHARIISIDTSKAEALPGVKAVLTGRDIPLKYTFNYVEHLHEKEAAPAQDIAALRGLMPPPRADRSPLAIDKVRYVGDEVAAVAAVDEATALDALSLIEVEYQRLPVVFDPDSAMKPGAPLIHEDSPGNLAAHLYGEWGNAEQGFKDADLVFEDTFRTQHQAHACMETHGCVCSWDAGGNLTMWTSTQVPHTLRLELARALRIPHNKVRIISEFVGGAFGSKTELGSYHIVCAHLARETGAPVKLTYGREEEFLGSGCRHPYTITLKTGVKKDGQITARECKIIADKGAYITQGAAVAFYAVSMPMGNAYKPPNVKFDVNVVYTNKQPPSAMRGFGNPQAAFAIESQMDMIAERLGMDPMQLRLRNATKAGDVTAPGFYVGSCGLSECIQKAAKAIGWEDMRKNKLPNRGVGMACLFHGSGERGAYGDCDNSVATVKVNDDGTVTLFLGAQDLGTGSWTALAQIAAEALGARFEDIRVVAGNTELPAFDLGSFASRTMLIAGNAVKIAASNARQSVLEVGAKELGVSIGNLDAREGKIFVKSDPRKALTFADVGKLAYYQKTSALVGVGAWDAPSTLFDSKTRKWPPPGPTGGYTFGCQAVEVEVNPETGDVRVLKIVTAHDVGRAINPIIIEGQLEGAVQQGLGYALTEHLRIEEGKTLVADFRDYLLRRAPDMPPIETILVETNEPHGAYGLKGVGEPAMVPVAPAIANAIYHAVGARVKDLPITREKVLKALETRTSGSLE